MPTQTSLGGEYGLDGETLDPLGLACMGVRGERALSTEPFQEPAWDDERPAGDHGWKRCKLPLLVELGEPSLEPRFELVRALARASRVQSPTRLLARELLLLELVGAVVPVL